MGPVFPLYSHCGHLEYSRYQHIALTWGWCTLSPTEDGYARSRTKNTAHIREPIVGVYIVAGSNNFIRMLVSRNTKRYMCTFTRLPAWCPVKSFRDDQEAWRAQRMEDISKTKQSFAKERRKSRVSYNRRSAFMKARSLNAVSFKEPWSAAKWGPSVPIWRAESFRLTSEGGNVYVRNVNLFSRVNVLVCIPKFNCVMRSMF